MEARQNADGTSVDTQDGREAHSMEQHTQWQLMNKHGDVLTSGVATFLTYSQGVSILSAKKVARKIESNL